MKKIYFIVFLAFASFISNAQDIGLTPPNGIFGGLNLGDNGVVGAIGGTVNVSELGGAIYSIPIQVPEGINGIQPNLSVTYNNQTGNGLLGWGWNLTGLSAITRTGQNMFYDDSITSVDFIYDRFLLDGQRLMLVNDEPYGGDSAEYKTEIDGMNRIESFTCDTTYGPAMFKVWLANGNIAYYGSRSDSRIGLKRPNDVCIWLLDSVTDRNGNYMSYHYYRGNIMYYLDYIVYTGNYFKESIVPPQYKVKFEYEKDNRLDKEQFFVGNYSVWQLKLLKDIKVYHMPSGTLQHKYDFEYDGLGLSPNHYSYDQGVSPELAYYYNRLKTITFSKDGCHYNPTRIEWGENDYDADNNRLITVVTQEGGQDQTAYSFFNDKVKFTGDFNGDGLTDIVVYMYSTPESARVYINQGNYRIPENNHFITKLRFRQLSNSLPLNDNTDWIYVADFNGDGLDDLLCLSRDRSGTFRDKIYIKGFMARLDNGEVVFDSVSTVDSYYRIRKKYAEAILVGDFLGKGKSQFYMQSYDPSKEEENSEVAYLFEYQNGQFAKVPHVNNSVLYAEKFTASDFNGDGVAEILYSSESAPHCRIVRLIKRDSDNSFRYQTITDLGGGMTYWHQIFPGDFNGDGHTDLLTYVPDSLGNAGTWQINLFKGDRLEFPCYFIEADEIGIDAPGNHSFSLHDRWNSSETYRFIEVADMNGDGKSDIVLKYDRGSNVYIRVLYAPLRRINGVTRFADIQETSLNISGIINNQTICLGNFYGTETTCLAASTLAWSRVPISNRYGVKSITDGMGNRTSFSFGYLTYNPLNNNNIYTLSDPGTNLGNNIYHIPLPMKAVKGINTYNAFDSSIPIIGKTYSYENAFAHRKGRGFLGFKKTIVQSSVGGTAKGRVVSEKEIASMGEKCLALPSTVKTYDGSNNMLTEAQYRYRKYHCRRDPLNKVFIVNPIKQITDNYKILGNRDFLRRQIVEKTYSYTANITPHYSYSNVVLEHTTKTGTDSSQVESFSDCDYQSVSEIQYETNDYNEWILGRPNSIVTTTRSDYDTIGVQVRTTYEYNSINPLLPSKVRVLPGNEYALGSYTSYTYDKFGHVFNETTNSILGGLHTSKSYHYSLDGRFLETDTIFADGVGYTNKYTHNAQYGHLSLVKDCNDFGTYTSNPDRMGITVFSNSLDPLGDTIDGSCSCYAVRWCKEPERNGYGRFLAHPAYYTWQKHQGEAESIVIYDAAGRELRSVSFGLTLNNAIYKDTKYDSQGRVSEVTEPYFAIEGATSVGKTEFQYDDYDRPTKTIVYDKNGTVLICTEQNYDGLQTTTTTYRSNNNKEMVSDLLNVMGWKEKHIDYLDPEHPNNSGSQVVVDYGYYADGKLSWTKVNGDENTKVTMSYNALGNRTQLVDPDYGMVTSQYNAFGQLTRTTTPKGNYTDYAYDGLGRLITRIENDEQSQTLTSTLWKYYTVNGKLGLLDSIDYNKGEQVVRYNYDGLNRTQSIEEKLFGQTYTTSYEYDSLSRVKKTEYPSRYVTRNVYSNETGLRVAIKDENWQMLWELRKVNAMGQIVEYQTGDGTVSRRDYDNLHRLDTLSATNEGRKIQDFIYGYDDFSNLAARTENKYALPMTERFTYDRLNRIDSIKFNSVSSVMTYDPHGRILSKQADGQMVFSGAQYNTYDQLGNLKPHAISSATVTSGTFPTPHMEAEYTTFDKVKNLTKYDGNNNVERTLAYTYGYDHQRIGMEEHLSNSSYRTKTYVGNCEFNHDFDCARTLTYLSAPTGLFAVHMKEDAYYVNNDSQGSQRLLYLHKDHLGSITTITDTLGNIVQELSYDAWGNLRNPTTWNGSFTGTPLIDRGFTSHEHLYDFGLINMNGRMYDPVMSSFLSVDSYVQDPENSQNFNRYAYCFNNPLRYTDPNGEFALIDDIVIAAVFGAIINGWIQGATGNINGIGDCGRALIGGAVTGAMGCGLSVVGGAGMSFGANLALGTVEGGATAAVGEWISGGDGEDILKAAAIGAAIGAITTTLTSENLYNAIKGKGFKTNAKVFDDFKAGIYTAEGECWQQDVIDYFEIDAHYTPDKYSEDAWFGAETGIHFSDGAFQSYDDMLVSYTKESFEQLRKTRGVWEQPDNPTGWFWEDRFMEEYVGHIEVYKNQGLYPKATSNLVDPIKGVINMMERINVRYDEIIYKIPVFDENVFWHFIYKIPRRY